MEPDSSFKELREKLKEWKLTALRLSANGRFMGYNPLFIGWINQLKGMLDTSTTTPEAKYEFQKALRCIEANNDDLFPEICNRLERTLILAEEVAFGISSEEWREFNEVCEQEGIDPNQKNAELIRIYLREVRDSQNGSHGT